MTSPRPSFARARPAVESTDGRGWSAAVTGADSLVTLSGDWIARVNGVDIGAAPRILQPSIRKIAFEAGALGHWDSALIAFLADLREVAGRGGVDFEEGGLPQSARRLLGLMADRVAAPARPAGAPLTERVGRSVLGLWAEGVETTAMVGSICLRGGVALRGRAAMRAGDLLEAMYDAGPGALPIVTVVNLLVGGILAFIAATELRKFGAESYVASLVAIGMVREMAALMTAIILSGRTGGAFAANIAAMQGAQEIDALRSMGIPVFDYLILPKILALTGMMPTLYLYGCGVGIVGGLLVSVAILGVTPTSFLLEARASLTTAEIGLGMAKSLVFGALIAILSCRVGLRAGRSAADVGHAATSAVVAGIVGVIALDAVFDLCADLLGI